MSIADLCGVARSHLDRHLAVLAELRLLPGQPRLGELENSNGSARRSIPQFRRDRLDPQQAYVGIVRAARPPHLIGLSPGRLYLVSIVHDTGAASDRQVGLVARIDKDKADIGRGLDLILLGAVNIGHKKNLASIAIGPCFERSRAQSAGELRRQHAHADLFDDVPDAVDVVFFAHVKHYTELHPDFQIHKARVPAATAHAGALSARTQALPWGARSHLLSAGIKTGVTGTTSSGGYC